MSGGQSTIILSYRREDSAGVTGRIFDRLVSEYGAVDVSYGIVRAYVAERRAEIQIAAGRGVAKAFVPQSHRPGAEAEVDFGDVTIRLAGQLGPGLGEHIGQRPAGSNAALL